LDLLQKTLVEGSGSRLYVTDGVEALNDRDYKGEEWCHSASIHVIWKPGYKFLNFLESEYVS